MVEQQDEQVANSNSAMASSSSLSERGRRDNVDIVVADNNSKNLATATKENIAPIMTISQRTTSTIATSIQDDDNSPTTARSSTLPFKFVQSGVPTPAIITTASRVSIDNSTSSPLPSSPSLFFDEEITIEDNNKNDDGMPPPPPRRERSTSTSLLITSPPSKEASKCLERMKTFSSLSPSCNTVKCTPQDATATADTTLVTPSPFSAKQDLNVDSGHPNQSNSSSFMSSTKNKRYLNSVTISLIDLKNDTDTDTDKKASSQEDTNMEQPKNGKSITTNKKKSKPNKKIAPSSIMDTTAKNQDDCQNLFSTFASSHQQQKESKKPKCRRARAKIVSYAEGNSSGEEEEEHIKSDDDDYECNNDNDHDKNQSYQIGRSLRKTRSRITEQDGRRTKKSSRITTRTSSSNKTNSPKTKSKVNLCGRRDVSLKTIGKEFYRILKAESLLSTCVDLSSVATQLGDQCHKRRIYDVLNVLEGTGLVEKIAKNRVRFVQNDHNKNKKAVTFMKRNKELQQEAQKLDKWIEKLQQQQPQKTSTTPKRLHTPEKETVSSPSNNSKSRNNHQQHFMYMNAVDVQHGLSIRNATNSMCLVMGGTHYKEAVSSSNKKRKRIQNDDDSHHSLSVQSKPSSYQKIFSVDYGSVTTPTLKPFHFLIPPPSLLKLCNSSFTIKALCATRPAGPEMMGASLPPSIQDLQSPIELATRPCLTLPVVSEGPSSLSTYVPSSSSFMMTPSPLVSRRTCSSNGSSSVGKQIPTIPLSREDISSASISLPSNLRRVCGSTRTRSSSPGKQSPMPLFCKKISAFSSNPLPLDCIPSSAMEEQQQTPRLSPDKTPISGAATPTIAANHNLLPESFSWFSPARGTHRTSSKLLAGVGTYESIPFSSSNSNLHHDGYGSPMPTISRTIATSISRKKGKGAKSPHSTTNTSNSNDTAPALTLPEVTPTELLSPFSAAAMTDFMDIEYTPGEGDSTTILPLFPV